MSVSESEPVPQDRWIQQRKHDWEHKYGEQAKCSISVVEPSCEGPPLFSLDHLQYEQFCYGYAQSPDHTQYYQVHSEGKKVWTMTAPITYFGRRLVRECPSAADAQADALQLLYNKQAQGWLIMRDPRDHDPMDARDESDREFFRTKPSEGWLLKTGAGAEAGAGEGEGEGAEAKLGAEGKGTATITSLESPALGSKRASLSSSAASAEADAVAAADASADPYASWVCWSRVRPDCILFTVCLSHVHSSYARWGTTAEQTWQIIQQEITQWENKGYTTWNNKPQWKYVPVQRQPTDEQSDKNTRSPKISRVWPCPAASSCRHRDAPSHVAHYFHPPRGVPSYVSLQRQCFSRLLYHGWLRSDDYKSTVSTLMEVIPVLASTSALANTIAKDVAHGIRTAWNITTQEQQECANQTMVSKVLGVPYLLPSEAWLKCSQCHRNMFFAFQIMVSSLPHPLSSALPPSGCLQFWFCTYSYTDDTSCPAQHPDRCRMNYICRFIHNTQQQNQQQQVSVSVPSDSCGAQSWLVDFSSPALIQFSDPTEDVPHVNRDIQHHPQLEFKDQQSYVSWLRWYEPDATAFPRAGDKLAGFPRFVDPAMELDRLNDSETGQSQVPPAGTTPTCNICNKYMIALYR